ncbi:MAG: hypothetical protein M3Y58_18585 [Chloroflexota bacterium]|nr:hypothetical protein [Chloroflexota bacterium]
MHVPATPSVALFSTYWESGPLGKPMPKKPSEALRPTGATQVSERERACIAPDDDDVRQPRAGDEEDRRDRRGLNTP